MQGLLQLAKLLVPTLGSLVSKGAAGRIAVIGGSAEVRVFLNDFLDCVVIVLRRIQYTGAPYFASIAAMRTGADLVYVITTPSASPIIKAYSPDLIVHPLLTEMISEESLFAKSILPLFTFFTIQPLSFSYQVAHGPITETLKKMHAIVIGPGLGRSASAMHHTKAIMAFLKSSLAEIPVVIDADGLYAIRHAPEAFLDHPNLILTPNMREVQQHCS